MVKVRLLRDYILEAELTQGGVPSGESYQIWPRSFLKEARQLLPRECPKVAHPAIKSDYPHKSYPYIRDGRNGSVGFRPLCATSNSAHAKFYQENLLGLSPSTSTIEEEVGQCQKKRASQRLALNHWNNFNNTQVFSLNTRGVK